MRFPDQPQYTIDDNDGDLVVTVAYSAGLDDDELIRLARKQLGYIAPLTVQRPAISRGRGLFPEPVREVRRLTPGAHIVWHSHPGEVLIVTGVRAANLDETAEFAQQGDAHRKWVHDGGDLWAVEATDPAGNVGSSTVPARNAAPFCWIVAPDGHWQMCATCQSPWPCVTHKETSAAAAAEAAAAAACTRCGRSDGNRFTFRTSDGFPERRVYHTRKGACLNAAVRYAAEHGWVMREFAGHRDFVPGERPV